MKAAAEVVVEAVEVVVEIVEAIRAPLQRRALQRHRPPHAKRHPNRVRPAVLTTWMTTFLFRPENS